MMTLFRNGGFPMYFILVFGLVMLVTALAYAVRPAKEREGFVKWMCVATIASVVSGTAGDFAAVAHYVETHPMGGAELGRIVVVGFGESMSPAIFGGSLLSLTALAMAVGRRRLDARLVG